MFNLVLQAEIHTDNLSLSLEPEAAALYCRYLPHDRVIDADGNVTIKSFAVGDRYLVLDVGGKSERKPAFEMFCSNFSITCYH